MVAPPVSLLLHCTSKSAVSVLPLLHSPAIRKSEKNKEQVFPIGGYLHRRSDSSLTTFTHSRRSNFSTRASERSSNAGAPFDTYKDRKLRQVDKGRCAIVSAAAALLIQCTCGEELAIATTYAPTVNSSYSSVSVDSFDRCNGAPANFASFTKRNRTGSHVVKTSIVVDGPSKQSTVAMGMRKPSLLVKRPGGYLPRLKSSLLSRQVACSSVAILPMASLSAATFSNAFTAISRFGLATLDLSVLRSSFGTSVNLLSLCTLVVWMQRSGQLPADTPVILSQVAFKLFIPCFLMSKVATTLTSSSASNLIALPLMAIVQVIVGAILGKVACLVFFRVPSFNPAMDWSMHEAEDSPAALAFTKRQKKISLAATKKQALVTAACAFGNSLTLPLVFLSGVLASTEEANRAAGYLALYMVGWSPAMWSVGFKILTAGDEKQESESSGDQAIWVTALKSIGSFMNPPLYGVLVGLLIGGTPLSHLFLGSNEGAALASTSVAFGTVGTFAKLRNVTAGILSPVFEAASLLGTATLAVQTVVLATSLGASVPKTHDGFRKISPLEADSENSQSFGPLETSTLRSEGVLDSKAFWVISLVRLIILPMTGIFFTFVLQCCHLLPADPIYRLVILAESAMPTAQNLVLLAQLNVGTRPLAGMLAELLLREYALSVIPLTMWMAIFLTFAPVA